MTFLTRAVLGAALILAGGATMQGATIISTTGPSSFIFNVGPTVAGDQALAVSWTTGRRYADVSIVADLFNNGFDPADVDAYLTTGVGPFANSATLVGMTTATLVPGDNFPELFHFSELMPGTYYLVLFSRADPSELGWLVTDTPTIMIGDEVTEGRRLYANVGFNPFSGVNTAYPPGSKFVDFDDPAVRALLNVTGTEIPEPAMALPVAALLVMGKLYLRRLI